MTNTELFLGAIFTLQVLTYYRATSFRRHLSNDLASLTKTLDAKLDTILNPPERPISFKYLDGTKGKMSANDVLTIHRDAENGIKGAINIRCRIDPQVWADMVANAKQVVEARS